LRDSPLEHALAVGLVEREAIAFLPPEGLGVPLELAEDELVRCELREKATSIPSALLTSESMCSMASGVGPSPPPGGVRSLMSVLAPPPPPRRDLSFPPP
jgi:hypothetical protein